ncbi:MAG: prephenate dehydrogenase [Pirellulales bacterium]
MSQIFQSQSSSPHYRQVAIVGVGLMGGSIGLALRERQLADEVVGIGRRQSSLKKALACGAVDRVTTDLAAGVAEAEVVVVAAPINWVPRLVREVAVTSPAHGLITDVGSVKQAICQELASLESFIGSHPLAGDHRSGPENARSDLLTGKLVVVTPLVIRGQKKISKDKLANLGDTSERLSAGIQPRTGIQQRVTHFWESLGASVEQLDPEEHDRALAATSHLPHWIASALAGATPEKWLPLVATGWRDTTRIAAADAELWGQIFTENKSGLFESLDRFIERLEQMRSVLESGKPLPPLLNEAKRIRNAVGD